MSYATETEKLDLRVSKEVKGALKATAEKYGSSVKAVLLIAILNKGPYGDSVRDLINLNHNRLMEAKYNDRGKS